MTEDARPGGAVGNGGEEVEGGAKLEASAARALTDRIKEGAENLWRMLLEAYEGGAHTALGYSSWGAYFEAEFGCRKSKAYQLLEAGRVVRAIDANSAIAERPTESQTRPLAPIAKTAPEGAARIWEAAVEEHGDPTAADVGRMVEEHVGGSSAQGLSELLEKLTPTDTIQALTERVGSKEILAALPPLTLAAIERAREVQGTRRDPLHDADQLGFLADIVEKHGDAEGALVVGALATGGGDVLSAHKGIMRERARERREHLAAGMREAAALGSLERFPVLLADPPWRYALTISDSRKVENQYPTMDLAEIKAMGEDLPAADDAVLFLWSTSPKALEALEVMAAWGFVYRSCMVWVKDRIGMGIYVRQRHELVLIGTRGAPGAPEKANRPDSVISAPRTRHSKKPAEIYDLIDRMYPLYPKLELFARGRLERASWTAWGNEAVS
jgi:N6-adenosine-specific RNA methylase IME4